MEQAYHRISVGLRLDKSQVKYTDLIFVYLRMKKQLLRIF